MFISVCAFSLMDVLVKWSDAYPVGQVLFFRGFCGIIPILFLVPKDRFLDFYKTSRPFLHFKRCLSRFNCLSFNLYSFKKFTISYRCEHFFCSTNFYNNLFNFFIKRKSRFIQVVSCLSWFHRNSCDYRARL